MKNFKVAHIVPVSELHKTTDMQYHMCLAHLVHRDKQYRDHFLKMSNEGKFVMMDNGAAEGSQLSFDKLFEAYEMVNPSEIVLPDCIGNPCRTIKSTFEFLNEMDKRGVYYKTMGVPQGVTLQEWCLCADTMMMDRRINTIGISKFLVESTGSIKARYCVLSDVAMYMAKHERLDNLEIHLLGCSDGPDWIRSCANYMPAILKVRGCDTAFAYLQAKSVHKCGSDANHNRRPDETIDFLNGERYKELDDCMKRFECACGCPDNGVDNSWIW